MRSLEQSHSRLGISSFDIVYIHDIDLRNHGIAYERQYAAAVEGAFRALAELRASGFIKAIGIGINESDVAADFILDAEIDLVMLVGRYTLLEQAALDDCLPTALARGVCGVGVVAVGVFKSGILAKGPRSGAAYDYGDAPPDVSPRRCARSTLPGLRRSACRCRRPVSPRTSGRRSVVLDHMFA